MTSSSGYDFSQLFHGSVLSFSPGTTFLATAQLNRIIIRSSASLQIVRTWECTSPSASSSSPATAAALSMSLGSSSRSKPNGVQASGGASTADLSSSSSSCTIDQLLWSGDSMYILAFSPQAKMAWIFGLAQDGQGECGEMARVGGEGVEGLVRVEWGRGNGREVLAWSDHGLKLSIYDLSTGETRYIQYPKAHNNTCHTYSPDVKYLAVAERHHGKDHVGIYDVHGGYRLIRHFPLLTTDVQGLLWSPCGKYIAAWDNALSYSLHIHSPIGPQLTQFSSSSPTFSSSGPSTSVATSSASSSLAQDPGMGIRTLTWAPGGRWIAVGGWDGKVRIVESEGWRCVAVMQWGSRTSEKDVAVWREPGEWLRETRRRGIVQFDRVPVPAGVPATRPDLSKPNPRMGITQISFDRDGTLLLIRSEASPSVVHVHTFLPDPTAESPVITHLSSIIFGNPVRSAKWTPDPEGGGGRRLAVVTRGGAVYFWDGEGGWEEDDDGEGDGDRAKGQGEGRDDAAAKGGMMEGVGIPARTDFSAHDIHWSPDGSALAIQDRENSQFCVLYDDPPVVTPTAATHEEDRTGQHRYGYRQPQGQGEGEDADQGLTHIYEEDEEDEDQEILGGFGGLGKDRNWDRDLVGGVGRRAGGRLGMGRPSRGAFEPVSA